MKGVILSGGMGSRLGLFAKRVANKHAALVYNRPMIEYPLSMLSQAGVTELAVVVSSHQGSDMMSVIGDGHEFGFDTVRYFVQHTASGIAGALKLTESFVGKDNFCVVLGDNFFDFDATDFFDSFRSGCKILLKPVHDPKRFGVAEVLNGKVISIEEKPSEPKSDLAITGFYLFDKKAFDYARTLRPSRRGELEITDILEGYMRDKKLEYSVFNGFWSDMGTPESLLNTANYVKASCDKISESGRFKNYRFKMKSGLLGDYIGDL